jgi:hypothetical protein
MDLACRRAAVAAWICAALNLAASAGMVLVLRHGLPPAPLELRAAFVREHTAAWTAGWALWMAAVLSLLAFYRRMGQALAAGAWGCMALGIALVGAITDLAGQAVYIAVYPRAKDPAVISGADPVVALLSGAIANGAYTLAWALYVRLAGFPRPLAWLAAAGIAAGAGLTVASAVYSPRWLVVTTAICLPLFILWSALVGRFFWRKARGADTLSPPCSTP